jgi:hypothetical protein
LGPRKLGKFVHAKKCENFERFGKVWTIISCEVSKFEELRDLILEENVRDAFFLIGKIE